MVLEMFLVVVMTMRRRTIALLLPALVFVAVGGIAYQWKMRAENQGSTYTYADSKDTRLQLWHAARVMFQDNPLLGVGSLSFGDHAKHYVQLSHDDLGKNAHNTYFDVAATSGSIGLLCFLAILVTTFKRLRGRSDVSDSPHVEKVRVAALISLLAIGFRALFDAKEYDWSFYTLAAIAVASNYIRQRHRAVVTSQAGRGGSISRGSQRDGRRVQASFRRGGSARD